MIDFHRDLVFMTVLDQFDKVMKEPKMETSKCEPPLEDVEGEDEREIHENIGLFHAGQRHAYPHNSGGGPRNPRRINQVGRQGQSAASKRFGFDFSCFSTFGPDQWG